MKRMNLFELMQNSAVGSIALHSFVLGYFNVSKNRNNPQTHPKLNLLFYVLPIVYNESARETFMGTIQLYTALRENKSISIGLQDRANKMSLQTFNALNISFSKKILTYNKTEKTIELMRGFQSKKLPLPQSNLGSYNSVKKIQDTAYRLGGILAKRDENTIQTELNILL